MIILAIDTSSQAASCALLRDGHLVGEFFVNNALTHSQTSLPMVEALLATTGIANGDVDYFAVSSGPGSFTGLRIGIAAVKGLAMGADKPCVPVSTLEALAQNAAGFGGWVVPVMDARRSQMYTAAFRFEGGHLTRQSPDTAMAVAELGEEIAARAPEPVLLVGDGALRCMELLRSLPHLRVIDPNLLHQRAGSVARVAARMVAEGMICPAADLAPSYLRLPQAERERLARLDNR